MTDARLDASSVPADRRPEYFGDDLTSDETARTAAPTNPWMRALLWTSVASLFVSFVLFVLSANAGSPDTAALPTWDFSTPGQIALVVFAFAFLFLTVITAVGWMVVRALQWTAPIAESSSDES